MHSVLASYYQVPQLSFRNAVWPSFMASMNRILHDVGCDGPLSSCLDQILKSKASTNAIRAAARVYTDGASEHSGPTRTA